MSKSGLFLLLVLSLCNVASADVKWLNVSDPVVSQLKKENKKIDWPGDTAGVTVDPSNGDVFMVVPGQGIWKSTDHGTTFDRCDDGKIGGRCETSYSLNFDPAGKRLACFMLDGNCGMTLDGGKTWQSFTNMGRNWDYAAVDWSQPEPRNIFAARHESGGEMYLSTDAGKSWKMIGKDLKFAGVGIFDDKTLVTTKGDGILRSTDSGATWTNVSNLQPVGRVVRVFHDTAYWLGKEGLLMSKDKGATWTDTGVSTDATLGPWFKDEKDIAVAGAKGIFETFDSGLTWKLIAPLPKDYDVPMPGWFTNVGFDPVNHLFYVSRMGKPTLKLVPGE